MSTTTALPVSRTAAPARRVDERPAGELRLTRRGRVSVLVAALGAMFAGGLFLSTTSVASDATEGYPTRVVMVAPGDTLWAIADDVAGSGSTQDMVGTIETLNDISGSGGLQAGQRLVVPLQ